MNERGKKRNSNSLTFSLHLDLVSNSTQTTFAPFHTAAIKSQVFGDSSQKRNSKNQKIVVAKMVVFRRLVNNG